MDHKPYNSELPNLRKHELIRMVEDLRYRIDLLEEESWPFEWVIASGERERRKAAENENARLREALERIATFPLALGANAVEESELLREYAKQALDDTP